MELRIKLKNSYCDTATICFISNAIETNGYTYQAAQCAAQDCMSALQAILDYNKNTKSSYSEADEILKFQKLMEQGIISKEEFEAKKRQLLGL